MSPTDSAASQDGDPAPSVSSEPGKTASELFVNDDHPLKKDTPLAITVIDGTTVESAD